MLVDMRLVCLWINVETKPHALSHTTELANGTATSNGEVEGRTEAPGGAEGAQFLSARGA
jgi:hypothetical protein